MENSKTAKLISFLSSTVIGLGISFAIAYWRGIFEATTAETVLNIISDGTFVTGMLYTGFGLLLLIANEGILDIFGFGFKSLVYLFTPRKLDKKATDYYAYRMKKKEEREGKKVNTNILPIGVGFILLSIVAVVLATVV